MSDDDTVYCDVQMPLAVGLELLQLVTALRSSGDRPALDRVFRDMQLELQTSIEYLQRAKSHAQH